MTLSRSHQPEWFASTHWSVVIVAGRGDSEPKRVALEKLCRTYWYPLYVFVRRLGYRPHDAEDLVQGFFAVCLEKNYLGVADQSKGRFRSFLLVALKRFLANARAKALTRKRGGAQVHVSLDALTAEQRYALEPADRLSPDKLYERRWALTLLEQVIARLQSEQAAAGRGAVFEQLKEFLTSADRGSPSAAYPGKPSLATVADLYESAVEGQSRTNSHDAELTRAFIVQHFSDIITNDEAWTRPDLRDHFPAATRSLLEQAVIGHLPPKPADLDEAARVLPARIAEQERRARIDPIWIGLVTGVALGLAFAIVELTGIGGFSQSLLLRLFGLAVVDRTGQPARRLRLLGRWLLAWALVPAASLIAVVIFSLAVAPRVLPAEKMGNLGPHAGSLAWTLGLGVASLVLAATIYTVRHPSRSLQDRLAGTRLVPR